MILLHVSDIHFRYPVCTRDTDPDRPYRTRLVQDVKERRPRLGKIDAILVGGDIAYAGKDEEYIEAKKWLDELAAAAGCEPHRIYVIPGNHDVDRQVIFDRLTVRNAQQAIIRAENKEKELARQLDHAETGPALLAPMETYAKFAGRYSCEIFWPEKVFWHHELELAPGVLLRIFGLTSTILSGGRLPDDDKAGDLYLSPQQTVLNPEENVVNLVMSHHPPDWFLDKDNVEDAVNGRASIHLFGHKHRQRISRNPSYVTFYAGAVNPDRQERDWKPGYNIIRLDLGKDAGGHPQLNVEAQLLEWQTNPEMFKPILDDDHDRSAVHKAPVRLRNITVVAEDVPDAELNAMVQQVAEAAVKEERAKTIVLRFWDLTMSDRREISQKLNLLAPGDANLSQAEKYGRALMRAGQRNLLDQLAEEIQKRERH
jgi:predicted phosphodiesterase